jgi:hypothetical protein
MKAIGPYWIDGSVLGLVLAWFVLRSADLVTAKQTSRSEDKGLVIL